MEIANLPDSTKAHNLSIEKLSDNPLSYPCIRDQG